VHEANGRVEVMGLTVRVVMGGEREGKGCQLGRVRKVGFEMT